MSEPTIRHVKVTEGVRSVVNRFMGDDNFVPQEAGGRDFALTFGGSMFMLSLGDDQTLLRSDRQSIQLNGTVKRFSHCHRYVRGADGAGSQGGKKNERCQDKRDEIVGQYDPVKIQILAEALFTGFVSGQVQFANFLLDPETANAVNTLREKIEAEIEKIPK